MKKEQILTELRKKGYYIIEANNLMYDYVVCLPQEKNGSSGSLYFKEKQLKGFLDSLPEDLKMNT